MIFVISNNQALPYSKSTLVLITVCFLASSVECHQGAGQKSRTSGPTLALRNQNMHFNKIPQVICMQGFEKLCFSFVEIYLCHSCLLPVWRTPRKVTSCLSLFLWKEHLSVRDPGWRQLSTHHWSINAAFSCNYRTSLLPRCFWHLHASF